MKTPTSTPFLLPPDDAVDDSGPWTDADGRPVGDRLDHWDPFTDLELFRSLDINLELVREACALHRDSAFAITASWYSNRTRLGGTGVPVELGSLSGSVRAPVSVAAPGSACGGRLEIRTTLVLRTPGSSPTPISPQRSGAILWTDRVTIALEGGSSRFPVTALDFSAVTTIPDDASWMLEWDPYDLDAPFLGDLRLLVNASNDTLLNALCSGANDAKSSVIRSFVKLDVAHSMIDGALANQRFVDDPEAFDDGSIGRIVFQLLATCWPGTPVTALASRRREDPGRLKAELQASLGVFE